MKQKIFKKKLAPWQTGLIGLGIAVGVYAVLKILMGANVIDSFYQGIVQKTLLDIILALGLNLITGITGQFSLGHAGFMSIGAYSAALFMIYTQGENMLFTLAAVLVGACLAGLLGFLIGVPTLRLRGDYLAIATLGFNEIVRIFIENGDRAVLGGSAGLTGFPLYSSPFTPGGFEMVFIFTVITFVVIRNLIKSSHGRACIAVREDEIAAESMGVNLTKTKIMAFVVGTFFAGLAGALYSGYVGIIQPANFGFMKSIEILMIVVLGGLGSIWGTVVAAIGLNILNVFLQDPSLAEVRMIIYALLLIGIMLVKSGETPVFVKLRQMVSPRRIKRLLKRKSSSKFQQKPEVE